MELPMQFFDHFTAPPPRLRGSLPQPMSVRFWRHVSKSDGCWLWTGPKIAQGYGQIWCLWRRRTIMAHRVAWEMVNGPIRNDMVIMHTCDVPSCVKIDHLRLGTRADNNADCNTKGRRNQIRGIAQGSAKLTDDAVIAIRAAPRCQRGYQVALAEKYGVVRGTISMVIQRKIWKHL
jgi:hypothetical protein